MVTLAQISQDALRTKILHTFEAAQHAWYIPLHIGPVDISINKTIWFLWIGATVTFLTLFIGSRLLKDRPGAYQVIVEEVYGFGRNLGGQVGEDGKKWFPYTLSLFVFILTLNLIGLIPNTYPVTANISFTLVLAFLTFILTQYEGFRRNGAGMALKSFAPPGCRSSRSWFPSCGASSAWRVHQAAHARDAALRTSWRGILSSTCPRLILYFGASSR